MWYIIYQPYSPGDADICDKPVKKPLNGITSSKNYYGSSGYPRGVSSA